MSTSSASSDPQQVLHDQTIASVRQALYSLQRATPFRGRDDLICDVERQLALLRGEAAQEMTGFSASALPWGRYAVLAIILATVIRVMAIVL
ncbi:MAG: hypothetical protein ACYC5M_09095 [Anaerolineae bacterium]